MSTQRWGGADSRKARATLTPMVLAGVACWRCGKPIRAWQEPDPETGRKRWAGQPWHAGHIIGREDGGPDDPSNLMPEHDHCSTSAGGKSGIRHAQAANHGRRSTKAGGSLTNPEQPTHAVRAHFLLGEPPDLSHVRAEAAILSPWPEDTDVSEAMVGAGWLALPLFPQGVEIASVLQAVKDREARVPLYRTAVVEVARRSTKTTAVLATLLGRCLERPGYKVASTAQTGVKARGKLVEMQTALRAAGFETDGLGQCLQGMGDTRIRFANGSLWQALPPDPAAFRSEAYDAVLVDEAGELAPEKADALLAGLLPTMDTRPTAQLVVAGTPGEVRAGLLWTRLEQLRAGKPRVGGVVYEAPDRSTFIDPETGAVDWELLARTHPGIGTLTDVETIVGNLDDMGLERWQREYLCLWPRSIGVCALDVAAWEDCLSEDEPDRPENAVAGWAVDKDGTSSAIVAAWRDAEGRANFDVLAFGEGYDWVPAEAKRVQEQHRGALPYDAIGPAIEVADTMSRPPYRVRTTVVPFKDQVGSHARLDKEIGKRNVVHYGDPELTDAVDSSAWRPAGGARMFLSRPGSCTLTAAATALWEYDKRNRTGGRRRAITGADLERKLRERGAA